MRITAVFAAIRLRSENIASLPKKIAKNTLRGEEAVNNHPVSRLIRVKPNPYMNILDVYKRQGLTLLPMSTLMLWLYSFRK